jgi:alkyl sulfatase BDS1-like metallo-beta-lactamase superfamily hydrolase
MTMSNPYTVERSWPPYFLEHRKLVAERQGTYKAGPHPVWTVHVPDGWIGNSTIIEGDDGLIVYDTSVGLEAGRVIADEIAKISDKPVVAVFYSHHHADHFGGTSALVSEEDVRSGRVRIYAWENFEAEVAAEFGAIMPRQAAGVGYYGGAVLPPEDLHHHGIALRLIGGTSGYIPPTHTFDADTELTIAGVRLNVFYTGGEAISEFGIHLPDFDMVIIGDEFFYGLPNIHSIRGSKPREPENYMRALDRVRTLAPEWLLGSHIIPIEGRDTIERVVTKSRDAVQYLWDQSIRLINQGMTPVELQHALRDLPEWLVEAPYTTSTYGTPFTTVPEFYTGWVSWFDGDATNLLPTPRGEKARRFVALMGGSDRVLAEARTALQGDDPQYAAELAQLVVSADPANEDARLLKAAALRARGYAELNPIARSWYLTGALELEGAFDPNQVVAQGIASLAGSMPLAEVVRNWRYRIDAARAGAEPVAIDLRVSDTGESFRLLLRNGVLIVDGVDDGDADATIGMPAARARGLAEEPTLEAPDIEVSGDRAAAERLIDAFATSAPDFAMHSR